MGYGASLPIRQGLIVSLLAVALTAGCTPNRTGEAVWDPYEDSNRKNHAFNKKLDQRVVSRVSSGGSGSVPQPVKQGVSNFAENIDRPRHVINSLLQGDIENAVSNSFRFVVDTAFGLGGIFGFSRSLGMQSDDTDFGETLATWGAEEGAYLELPFVGPSTERDAIGKVVDVIINPVRLLEPEVRTAATVTGLADSAITRDQFGDTVDDILYNSADSYAQTRLLYLQNRRFEVGGGTTEEDYVDPYEDIYE